MLGAFLPQVIKYLRPPDLEQDNYFLFLEKKDIEAVEEFERDFHYYHPNNANEYNF